MTSILKNLLFALGLALIVWLGYAVFFQGNDSVDTQNEQIAGQAVAETQVFLARLHLIRSLKIDGAIFKDTRFSSLVDFREELVPEPTGRRNPFAPVE